MKDKLQKLWNPITKRGIQLALILALMFTIGLNAGQVVEVVNTNFIIHADSQSWGLGFGEEGTTPTGTCNADALKDYGGYYVGDGKEKVIYLTFDAGYENGNTGMILDALKKHKAPATFFVVGNYVDTAPEMVERMVAEGHMVGNHTYHHPDMTQLSPDEFTEEMEQLATGFETLTGEKISSYYRPPQGKFSVDNLKQAQKMGYKTIFWSLAYVDWYQDNQPTKEEAFSKLIPRTHPGAVVLLHNTSQTNAEILDELLTKWEEMGYTFKSLDELTK